MEVFIQKNTVWLVPLLGIGFTIILKAITKPTQVALELTDLFDFGFDLTVASLVLYLTSIKNNTGVWLFCVSIMAALIVAIIVGRHGWNPQTNSLSTLGILLPDILGIAILVIVTLYVGGKIT